MLPRRWCKTRWDRCVLYVCASETKWERESSSHCTVCALLKTPGPKVAAGFLHVELTSKSLYVHMLIGHDKHFTHQFVSET